MTVLPPVTQPQMAAEWFRCWFGDVGDAYATVSLMKPGKHRTITRHFHITPKDCIDSFGAGALMDDMVYGYNTEWNLYMSVSLMKDPPKDSRKKGGKHDVTSVPGVWVDLDTDKSGFFDDENECLTFLRELPQEVWPTIVVATGTGGVHAYWRCERDLEPDEAEALCTMWWTYLSERTDRKIDKLVNCDRVMKLPGSVRWPKVTGDAPALVRLLYADGERRVLVESLKRYAEPVYNEYLDSVRRRRERVTRGRLEAAQVAGELSGWNMLIALSTVEDAFNEEYTWDEILGPLGWVKLDQDAEGRDIWARPGLASWELHKSASTDYQGSHVMTLFSDSEETGLAHLLDTGATLTKYRVFVETVWNGDEAGFVRAYLSRDQG